MTEELQFDPSSPLPQTASAVREALIAHLQANAPAEEVRVVLSQLAREARQHHVPPERLIVLFKDIWRSLPTVQDASTRQDNAQLLERMITLCIREYYAE